MRLLSIFSYNFPLSEAPFSACHTTVSYGTSEEGVYRNCRTDVCMCLGDDSCACSQFDVYAQLCIDAGVDLSNWREDVVGCRKFTVYLIEDKPTEYFIFGETAVPQYKFEVYNLGSSL